LFPLLLNLTVRPYTKIYVMVNLFARRSGDGP